jgi:hypothetical protein
LDCYASKQTVGVCEEVHLICFVLDVKMELLLEMPLNEKVVMNSCNVVANTCK